MKYILNPHLKKLILACADNSSLRKITRLKYVLMCDARNMYGLFNTYLPIHFVKISEIKIIATLACTVWDFV